MKKILIIEDDLYIRENVYEVLELSGYEVYAASNGKEGLNTAFDVLPDLIICDIMMPVMDGYEVRQKLTENIRTKTIPFVFLTAKTEIKELRHGMSLGADDYITKPFEVKDLLNSINLRFEKIEDLKDTFMIEEAPGNGEEPAVIIKSGGATESIPHEEIILIKGSERNSEIIRTGKRKYLIQKNIKYWEAILPERNFLRIPQSVIINTGFIDGYEKTGEDLYSIRIKNLPEPVVIEGKQWNRIKNLFN